MKKILILIIILATTIGTLPIFAEESNIKVVIPSFTVILNDVDYDSTEAMYPLINYKGITYFPITWNLSRSLGLSTKYSKENGLEIKLGQATGGLVYNKGEGNDVTTSYKASLPSYKISVNGRIINNNSEDYPILNFRDITYFPLTWKYAVEEFKWEYHYANDKGLNIIAEVETEPVIQETDIDGFEKATSSEIVEITNSFRTANQWKIEDEYFHLGLSGDDHSLDFKLDGSVNSLLNSGLDYNLFAYVVELYSNNEMTYKLTLYQNYKIDKAFNLGLGNYELVQDDDLKDVDKVVYRLQFMERSKCEAYFEDIMLPKVDLSKLKDFTPYIESREKIHLVSEVVDGEILNEKEEVQIINVLPTSVMEENNIVYQYGSGFSSQNNIYEVVDYLVERLSMDLFSTIERKDSKMNISENGKLYDDKESLSMDDEDLKLFSYIKSKDDSVSLYFLLDRNFNIIGYIDYN